MKFKGEKSSCVWQVQIFTYVSYNARSTNLFAKNSKSMFSVYKYQWPTVVVFLFSTPHHTAYFFITFSFDMLFFFARAKRNKILAIKKTSKIFTVCIWLWYLRRDKIEWHWIIVDGLMFTTAGTDNFVLHVYSCVCVFIADAPIYITIHFSWG